MVRKTTKGFNTSITLYSIFGFVTLFLLFFFNIDINRWGVTALMLLSGGALLIEGNAVALLNWAKDGISGKQEFMWLATIIAGLFIFMVGILKSPMFNYGGILLDSAVGYVSAVAIIFLVWQRWFVK